MRHRGKAGAPRRGRIHVGGPLTSGNPGRGLVRRFILRGLFTSCRFPMTFRRLAAPFAVALLVTACASSPTDKTPTAGAPAQPAAVAPATPAVKVPAAAARKVVLAMTGPKTVVESKDWPEFQREWRETFAEHAQEAGISFTFHEGPGAPAADAGTLLQVQVNDYRIVGIGA